jgi:pimeloyl-ACP methyl ester carboxylesterase
VQAGLSRWRRGLTIGLVTGLAAIVVWTWWAEDHPREERRLRTLVHDRLHEWFPGQMSPDDSWHGIHPRAIVPGTRGIGVVLVHGLDEPGTIWDDLVTTLAAAGFAVWEFRYPNDQGIDRSADYLAQNWSTLAAERPVALVGHSMGGLVIRDFVSRLRHPVREASQVAGAAVAGVIVVGTPNHGSEWARLRIWLELRDQFPTSQGRRFSLFEALRDGTGEAKIDLRPGSDFLRDLNARPWPPTVPILSIAGRLLAPPEDLTQGLDAVAAETRSGDLRRRLSAWWSGIGEGLGDGVVTLDSARIPGAPPPLVVNASHRGMVARLLQGDPEPPAIPVILATLRGWDAQRMGSPPEAADAD